MTQGWQEKEEKTPLIWFRLLWWVARVSGRQVTRWVLLPITFLYFLMNKPARAHSRDYLSRVLQVKPSSRQIFQHFLTFATVSLDRLFLLAGRVDIFDIEISGMEYFSALEGGALLITSHFGSHELMRVLAQDQAHLRINVLMDKAHNKHAYSIVSRLNPELAKLVIDAGQPDPQLIVALSGKINDGHLIGIMADRIVNDQQTLEVKFLGDIAPFPLGPWVMASIIKCPVIYCFGTWLGGNRYHIDFEQPDMTAFEGNNRKIAQQALTHYVQRLESHVVKAPLNWFNFYSFWTKTGHKE